MSELYKDLPYTNYPNQLDTFFTWLDIVASDGNLIKEYQEAMQNGNQALANQALAKIPSANQKIVKATDLNKLTQAIQSVERFYKTDIQPYTTQKQTEWLNVINQFEYKGTWSISKTYQKDNIVSYEVNQIVLLYLANKQVPTGTPVSNSEYWRVLSIQGVKGDSGVGLSYSSNWQKDITYKSTDTVTYNNTLWQSKENDNSGNEPNDYSSEWIKLISFKNAGYPVQPNQPATQKTGDIWGNTNVEKNNKFVTSVNGQQGDITVSFQKTLTLLSSNWQSDRTYELVDDIFKTDVKYNYIITPASDSIPSYVKYEIYADDVKVDNQIVFYAFIKPNENLKINVLRVGG